MLHGARALKTSRGGAVEAVKRANYKIQNDTYMYLELADMRANYNIPIFSLIKKIPWDCPYKSSE